MPPFTAYSLLLIFIASTSISSVVAGRCKSKAAGEAFAADDISAARVALSKPNFKRSAAEVACAQKLWVAGIESMLDRGSNALAASRSKVEEYLNDGHGGCEVFTASEVLQRLSLVMPVLPDQLAMRIYLADRSFLLEQDSFLREGDSATVLWPAGLRLAEWLVKNCELMKGRVLEIGAGLALPALVASSVCRDTDVTATDKEPYALLNMRFHAGVNAVEIKTGILDMSTDEHLQLTVAEGRFDVVLAADMEVLEWTETDWSRLAKLLRSSQSKVFLCMAAEDVIELMAGGLAGSQFLVEPFTELKLFEKVPIEKEEEIAVDETEASDEERHEEEWQEVLKADDDDDAQAAQPPEDDWEPGSPWIVVQLQLIGDSKVSEL